MSNIHVKNICINNDCGDLEIRYTVTECNTQDEPICWGVFHYENRQLMAIYPSSIPAGFTGRYAIQCSVALEPGSYLFLLLNGDELHGAYRKDFAGTRFLPGLKHLKGDFSDEKDHMYAAQELRQSIEQGGAYQQDDDWDDWYNAWAPDGEDEEPQQPPLTSVSLSEMGDRLDELMKPLDELTGLDELKQTLRDIYKVECISQARRDMGLPPFKRQPCHFIFTGNPGTGKTTVARLLGRVLHEMGLISEGDVVCHDRRSLVGEFIGETERKFSDILLEAKGNVLFIDEAYSLFVEDPQNKDFGRHVLEALLTVTTDPDSDLIVVLAGYEQKMQQLLDSNPGLRSRFTYHFNFKDFTDKELVEIGRKVLEDNVLELDEAGRQALERVAAITREGRDEHFGNGRWMTGFITNAVMRAMANRLLATGREVTIDEVTSVTAHDILSAAAADPELQRMKARAAQKNISLKRRVGFVA